MFTWTAARKNANYNLKRNFFDAPDHYYYYFKNLGNQGVENVIKQVYKNPKMASLNVAHNNLNDEIIQTIIELLIQRQDVSVTIPFTELDLSGNNFTNKGITQLLNAIEAEKTCQLKTLNITGNVTPLSQQLLDKAKNIRLENGAGSEETNGSPQKKARKK